MEEQIANAAEGDDVLELAATHERPMKSLIVPIATHEREQSKKENLVS